MMDERMRECIDECHACVTRQSAEIEMMQTWLQDWYGITYQPEMHLGEMKGHMMMELVPEAYDQSSCNRHS
jgi:uncharacterized protein (DUF305 family)